MKPCRRSLQAATTDSTTALAPAACGFFNYTSPVTNSTYILNQCSMDQPSAQQFCNDNGGHLVGYKSLAEQQDVEDFFVSKVGS